MKSLPPSKDILFEQHGEVGILTLNRPRTLNATTRRMMSSCRDLIADLSETRSIRALVVTGTGNAFCSGADLGKGASAGITPLEESGRGLADDIRATLNPFVLSLNYAPFPVVAALNGAAAGAGAGLALACDFIVAARSSRLLLTFSRIGMGLDAGTSWFLTHALGQKRALALSMLSEPITADDMLDLGIAWKVVGDEDLMDESLALAGRLGRSATLALAAQKRQIRFAASASLEESLDAEAVVQGELVSTQDVREGVSAFRERRDPEFFGH